MFNTFASLFVIVIIIIKVLVLENLLPVGPAKQQVRHR